MESPGSAENRDPTQQIAGAAVGKESFMGKAVIDLPDPLADVGNDRLSDHLEAGTPPSVDDLLAQMAGEEIDRLLADADEPRERTLKSLSQPKPKQPTEPETQVDRLTAAVESAKSQQVEPAAVIEPTAPASSEGPRIAIEPSAPAPKASAAGLPALEEDGATSIDEREALALALEENAPIPDAQPIALEFPEVDPPTGNADGSLPFYLKPLEWLNAPLDACPEAVRGVVGKVALLTLFNAAAVLVYVIVFRKHR
jgi:hypothetical protein